jgi:hypothetical protein
VSRRSIATEYALSVQQPWAWAILHAGKDIENRTWAPPRHIVGRRVWIHASKKRQAIEPVELLPPLSFADDTPDLADLPLGAILGSVRVVGSTHEATGNRWFMGPIGWVLADPSSLPEPVPARGRLGVWAVPGGVVERLSA